MSMTKNYSWLRRGLVAIVLVHGAIALWHGAAHTHVPVPLTPLQTAFVGIVIVLLPFVGIGLLWTKQKKAAAWVIAFSMLASLIFGIVNHYVLDSPDNVSAVPEHEWRHTFVLSAALVAVSEAIGAALGAFAALKWREVN
jgi:hypothetical protein